MTDELRPTDAVTGADDASLDPDAEREVVPAEAPLPDRLHDGGLREADDADLVEQHLDVPLDDDAFDAG